MMSRFVTDAGLQGLTTAATALFVTLFVGVLGYLFVTRRMSFDKQKELPFHDEQQKHG